MIRFVLIELALCVALVVLIFTVMQHACSPDRDRQRYIGRHHELVGGGH